MKKVVTILLLSCFIQFNYAQIPSIKKQLRELYFDINFPISKYDFRKKINGDENFNNISENNFKKHECITTHFDTNYKISYASNANNKLFAIWFDEGTDINFCASLELSYAPKDINSATKQYNEVIEFFKKISFNTSTQKLYNKNEKNGDALYFYSSEKSYKSNLAYLVLKLYYVELEDNQKFYLVSSLFYKKHLY